MKKISYSLLFVSLFFNSVFAESSVIDNTQQDITNATQTNAVQLYSQSSADRNIQQQKDNYDQEISKASNTDYSAILADMGSSGSSFDDGSLTKYAKEVAADANSELQADLNNNYSSNATKNNSLRAQVKENQNSYDAAMERYQQMISNHQNDDKVPHAQDYGDNLTQLVDTSNDSYERLLAEADRILDDGSHSKARETIDKLAQNSTTNIKSENAQQQNQSILNDEKKAKEMIKEGQIIDNDFKSSHSYYKGKSAKDYVDQEVKKYDKNYKTENYQSLLDNITTPEEIDASFKQIDDDEQGNYKYKLSDGYPIEQITTVGLLTGQDQSLKKCLIMKTYGGGTWRTYCQPLKKPTQCSDYDWQQLTTKAIMYC